MLIVQNSKHMSNFVVKTWSAPPTPAFTLPVPFHGGYPAVLTHTHTHRRVIFLHVTHPSTFHTGLSFAFVIQ